MNRHEKITIMRHWQESCKCSDVLDKTLVRLTQ